MVRVIAWKNTLEIHIGNTVGWKHKNRFEKDKVDEKQKIILVKNIVCWKQDIISETKTLIRNNHLILETYLQNRYF